MRTVCGNVRTGNPFFNATDGGTEAAWLVLEVGGKARMEPWA